MVSRLVMVILAIGWSSFCSAQEPLLPSDGKKSVYTTRTETINPRTISESGQFIVYGPDGLTRRKITDHCKKIRQKFDAVLKEPNRDWNYSMVLQIHHSDSLRRVKSRAVGKIHPIPDGFRFQIDLLHDDEFQLSDLRHELVRMLLYERMYYPHNRPIKNGLVPKWLVTGVEELIIYRDAGRPTDVFASIIAANQLLSVPDIMTRDPDAITDSVTLQVYRACSAALVQSLLDQGSARLRFLAFLQDLALEEGPADEMAILRSHFKTLQQDDRSLDKWWTLQIAEMSQKTAFDFFNVAETDELIRKAIQVRIDLITDGQVLQVGGLKGRINNLKDRTGLSGKYESEFTSGTLWDFEKFLAHPKAPAALQFSRQRLLQMRQRIFPLYRPILDGYVSVIINLESGDAKETENHLAILEKMRQSTRQQMKEVNDYMNWFGATQVEHESDVAEGYRRAQKLLDGLEQKSRNDPITRYMDAIEREFE